MDRAPSLKTLKSAFGQFLHESDLRLLRKILAAQTRNEVLDLIENSKLHKTQAQINQMYNLPSRGHAKLLAADEMLEGYGIEDLRTRRGNYEYVNMGDTYTTTILRKRTVSGNNFFVSTWGDIVEREGSEGDYW